MRLRRPLFFAASGKASSPIFVSGVSSFTNVFGSVPVIAWFTEVSTSLEPGGGFTEAKVFVLKRTGPSPLSAPAVTTGVALTFPKQSGREESATRELRLPDEKGSEVGRKEIAIPANGQQLFLVEEVFPEIGGLLTRREFIGTLEMRFPTASPVFGKAVFLQTEGRLLITDKTILKIK
ncbi:MAG TPA: hypothetical protein VGK99_07995 [Acidobacteriota bacterium]